MAAIFSEVENADLLRVDPYKAVVGDWDSSYPAYDNPFRAMVVAAIDCGHSIHAASADQSPVHHDALGIHVHGLGCLVAAGGAAMMWLRGQCRMGRRRLACRR